MDFDVDFVVEKITKAGVAKKLDPLIPGQSVWFNNFGAKETLRARVSELGKSAGRMYCVRTLTEDGVRGARVWRLE